MVANAAPAPQAVKKHRVVDVSQYIPTAHAKKINQKASAALRAPPKGEANRAGGVQPSLKQVSKSAPEAAPKVDAAKVDAAKADAAKVEPKSGGSEVSKLKQQLRNLKKMNDFLSKKLDKMSKGHKELSNEHKSLKDSLRRMTAAEGQLVEELLTKVREKEMLSSTLQKVLLEKEELELIVQSIGMKIDEGNTSHSDARDAMTDSDESASSDAQFDRSFQSGRKFHESFHSDVIYHDSSYSDIELCESVQSDMEGVDVKGEEGSSQSEVEPNKGLFGGVRHARSLSEAEFRVEFGGEALTLNKANSSDGVLPSYDEMRKKFKGRGTIRFYSVLEELFK